MIFEKYILIFYFLQAPGKNDKDLPSDTTVWWKRDGCSAFEKPPVEKKLAQDGGRKRHPCFMYPTPRAGSVGQIRKNVAKMYIVIYMLLIYYPTLTVFFVWAYILVVLGGDWEIKNCRSCGNGLIRTRTHLVRTVPLLLLTFPSILQVYCWKGLRFSARQDLEGFSRFTEHGIEGVVPLELLPLEVRSKYQAKPGDRTKRAKKDETKGSTQQVEDTQVIHISPEITYYKTRYLNDGEGATGADGDGSSVSGEGDEHQKHNSDTDGGLEAGQIEGDTGMADADADLDVVA
ncbi:hypothetical protein SASPL_156855 [Salvia splendens]|uniref:Uncharacterized protein n=1 Tax=Salvia splendens TaxID=180675 RepID=A0A8X8VW40_SALSN|nr:hypothetical protein SASPL_156855 [Salvia splendens]